MDSRLIDALAPFELLFRARKPATHLCFMLACVVDHVSAQH